MTPTSQHKKEKTPEKKQKKYDLSSVPEASLIVNHRLWSGSIALDQPRYKKDTCCRVAINNIFGLLSVERATMRKYWRLGNLV